MGGELDEVCTLLHCRFSCTAAIVQSKITCNVLFAYWCFVVISHDFSGTSTDVSRYAGQYEHVFETTTAGVAIQAPQVRGCSTWCLFVFSYWYCTRKKKESTEVKRLGAKLPRWLVGWLPPFFRPCVRPSIPPLHFAPPSVHPPLPPSVRLSLQSIPVSVPPPVRPSVYPSAPPSVRPSHGQVQTSSFRKVAAKALGLSVPL